MKKIIAYITVLIMSVFMIPIVNAEEKTANSKETIQSAIDGFKSTGGTIKLDGEAKEITLDTFLTINATDATKNITIDFNGHTLTRTNGGNVILDIEKGNVILKDSSANHDGGITKTNGMTVMIKGTETDVTVESGNYKVIDNTGNYTAIQVSEGAKLTVKGTANIEGNYGITVFGDKAKVNIEGGTIKGEIGISGNGSETTNSEINISGGKIVGGSAAIYQPQTGALNISGGTLEGKIGVVARQGDVKVTDKAIINATGTAGEKCPVGDAKTEENRTELSCGVGIIVDNNNYNGGYAKSANVKITGGVVNATAATAVESHSKNDTDFEITGGEYSKPFNEQFVKNNNAEVQVGSTYYVGNDAKEALENANSGTTVTVLQGNLTSTNVKEGVTVENKGDGTVVVNGSELTKNEKTTIPVISTDDEEKEEKVHQIVTGVTYEDNGEDIEIEGSIVTESNDTYNAMIAKLKEKGYDTIYKMYEFHVKDNKTFNKSITITFDLGKENNGKVAYILHQKHDNSYEAFEYDVKDGKVSITVTELSPFVVALKDKETVDQNANVTENKPTNNAQTGAMDIIKYGLLAGFTFIGFVALTVYMKKEER